MARVIFNTENFVSRMNMVDEMVAQQAKEATRKVAEDLLTKSQDQVPLDKGTLQASGHAEHNENESIVAYGGSSAPYAVYQHEGMRRDGSHVVTKYTYPGRKRKYLEDPMRDNLVLWRETYGMIIGQILI